MNAKDKLIFALDVPSLNQTQQLIAMLHDHVGAFKIGLELFCAVGPRILYEPMLQDTPVLLDLKLCDIPATVERTVKRFQSNTLLGITVHTQGGKKMLEAATSVGVPIYGVTVLTSLNDDDLRRECAMHTQDLVRIRAQLAAETGCSGIVASPLELQELRQKHGFEIITPGIRLTSSDDDQKRTDSPCAAIVQGASRLVVGRPIRDAADPVKAADTIVEHISMAMGSQS